MDSSRRAVESYWRSRMIDGATSNEDKVAPVYKFEEICELLRSSDVSIVKEVSEFVLKRLDHKSPIVKHKALRLIKYCVGKSGVDFQREMQRHSVAVRQLLHYRGQPDPLKGDALNKAVRDSAQEAIAAIFGEQDSRPAPAENLSRRIEGFGNTNFHMPTEDKKSFLSEVVVLGSASIKQGLSSFTQGHSFRNNDNGSYRGPNLQRSLTVGKEYSDRYVPVEIPNENQSGFGTSRNVSTGSWNSEARVVQMETSNGESNSNHPESKTREERLLDTIVTSGGVRLQPTRDAIQVFLMEAAKLEALALSRALESKLQLPQWQVRMKAVCVLDSIIRKKDDEPFSIIASYFSDNKDTLVRCSESPQASLREKAYKVLSLLGGEQASSIGGNGVKPLKAEKDFVEMPNLIDTGDSDSDNIFGTDDSAKKIIDQNAENPTTHSPLIDDLFGGGVDFSTGPSLLQNDDDPFADVSFHTNEGRDHADDIFNGMNVSESQGAAVDRVTTNTNGIELFDSFGSSPKVPLGQEVRKDDVTDLIAGLSINEDASKTNTQNGTSILEKYPANQVSNDAISNLLGSQASGIGANGTSFIPSNLLPGMMLNPAFVPQAMNYGPMGNFFNQQQLLATMAHFQNLGNLTAQNVSASQATGNLDGYASPFPDIFQSNFPNQTPTSTMNNLKKEDTKAFDFISDHLASARDPKRVL
ncbi:protein MODIFIED TRANSPORT TO THE VACUOLE 1-like [Punica granatum]|uniref:Protein MODIFIED TRANSPORT TO THE VACUOLE 1-like n=1 Tax=Punica granatum TaxID=22663 RepID=A0A6P8CQT7_PUNGR|nr:protein MODIFIED TRANSPORT TO THE VACUOLE 1-like [Punica granatum]